MEGSISFLSFSVSIGLFLGISMVVFLFFKKSAKNKSNIYLGILTMCSTLYLIDVFVYLTGYMEYFPNVYRAGRLGAFIGGPTAYLYVRACTEKNFKMTPKLWLHFIPFVLNIATHIPIYGLSAGEKVEYFRLFMETGVFRSINEHPILPLLGSLQLTLYCFFAVWLIFKYRKHVMETSSYIDNSYHNWLLVFSSFFAISSFVILFWISLNGKMLNLGLLYSSFTFFNICVFVSALLKPEFFHAFPHQMSVSNGLEEERKKYESSNLQEEQKRKYLEKLSREMDTGKYYKEPELTIQQLSDYVNIPPHYLSQIINEKLGYNFLDFINKYRVEAAKELLVDAEFEHYSITAIGFEAGFNSKSTFYSAFKKFTSTTPGGFRKSMVVS